MVAVLCAGGARADEMWAVFEARCLVPYEHIVPPDLAGLARAGSGWRDGAFVVETTAETCAVRGGVPGPLGARLAGRDAYGDLGTGVWQSTTWREPRIEVEALADGYLVRETDLEA